MKLSVVILNYNVRYFLELCLQSVQSATAKIDAEIIVVDNNSTDDSCEMVKTTFPEVILIENKSNYGFSKGNNIGIEIAKGEYICILNPDTIVPETVFDQLLNFAQDKANLGLVGCKLIDGRGRFLPESKRNIPYPIVALKKIFGSGVGYYANHLGPNDNGKVDILVGAFMLVKKETYIKVNGFDEAYFMYGEDIDLSYKMLQAGLYNYYFGNIAVVHFKGESTSKDSVYIKRFYGAMQIFYEKHFKRNRMLDVIVQLAIKLAIISKSQPTVVKKKFNSTVVYTKSPESLIQLPFKTPVRYESDMNILPQEDEQVIYDLTNFNHKDVIRQMQENSKSINILHRFLPKSSNFIIGSDSSSERGEVIML